MSLNLMFGADDVLVRSDATSAGLINNYGTLGSAGGTFAGGPSINGFPGRSITLTKPYGGAAATAPLTATNSGDVGVFRMNTVKSYWDSGGFCFAARTKFNSTVSSTFGITAPSLSQLAVNPATNQVYIVGNINSQGTGVYTSKDNGVTWALVPPPAGVTVGGGAVISYTSNNVLFLTAHGVAGGRIYSTTDDGITWNQTGTIAAATTGIYNVVYTGDPAWPYATIYVSATSGQSAVLLLSDRLGTTTATPINSPGAAGSAIFVRVVGGYVITSTANGYLLFGNIAAGLATAGNWVTRLYNADFGVSGAVYGIDFNSTLNKWLINGGFGIYAGTNPGTAGAPLPPPAATAFTAVPLTSTSAAMTAVCGFGRIGSQMFTAGDNAVVAYSTDSGATWTFEQGSKILARAGQGGYNQVSASNTQFFMHSDSTASVFGYSLNADHGWTMTFAAESSESSGGSYSMFGVYSTLTLDSTGVATYPSGNPGLGFYVTGASGNSRTLQIVNGAGGSILASVPITDAQVNRIRYMEVIGTKDAGTVNSFFLTVRVDGSTVYGPSPSSYSLASTSDTTTFLIANLIRSGQITAFDDITFTDYTGPTCVGPLGVSVIMPITPASDVQAQWDRVGGASSNAASVARGAASNSSTTQWIETTTLNSKDIYASDNGSIDPSLVAGYSPRAVQVETFFSRQGSSLPQVKAGVVINGTETQGTAVTASTGQARAFVRVETGAGVTPAQALAARMTIQKTT